MTLSIDIVLDLMAIEPATVWQMIKQSHGELLSDSIRGYYGSVKCKLGDVSKRIVRSGKPHFGIELTDGEIIYAHVANFDHSLVWIRHLIRNLEDAAIWIQPFEILSEFRQAWVYNDEFNKWQNAEDPLTYKAAGRCLNTLPRKSNELPYPLEMMIIDISNNPGRRIIRKGYIEAVGAMMWIGEQFWQLTGAKREMVLNQDWLKIEQRTSSALKIQAFNEPFTTAEGIQGELQNRLRTLLFPSD